MLPAKKIMDYTNRSCISGPDGKIRREAMPPAHGSNIFSVLSSKVITLELIVTVLLVTAAFVCAWPEIKGMATSSLWQDELYTIDRFSSKGPAFVTTHYNANNHIFFNILCSLTTGENRFQPLPARFWSFLCITLTLIVTLVYHAWARRPFDGGAQMFLLLANLPTLDLLLQARGYGFLAAAALACTILAWHYFRRESLVPLICLPLVVWLGTWTVPTFVFFGGGLLVIMLIYTRDRRWLISGASALIAIVLAYWPVRASLLQSFSGYSKDWGKQFANWNAISDLLSSYLFFRMGSWFTFLMAVLVIVVLSRDRIRSAQSKASLCAGCAILFTFVVCLKMETPPQRTVVYLVAPFAFILVTLLSEFFRKGTLRKFRLGMMVLVVVAAFMGAWQIRKTFHFRPMESWLETAHRIESSFPKGIEIVAQFRPQWLRVYLSTDYPIVKEVNLAKFRAGRQIVVDSSFWAKSSFPLHTLPEGYSIDSVPQRRGGMQKIYYFKFVGAAGN